MVPREGFEPPACGIEAHCSNPLSYRGVPIHIFILSGAGGESRTLVSSLENWSNNRYTTPARREFYHIYLCNERLNVVEDGNFSSQSVKPLGDILVSTVDSIDIT